MCDNNNNNNNNYIIKIKNIIINNNNNKLLWDFDIHTDHQISARRPDLNQQKQRTCKIVNFAVPADYRIKVKECEKKDKYLDLARELKKTMEHAGENYTNCYWCVWNIN